MKLSLPETPSHFGILLVVRPGAPPNMQHLRLIYLKGRTRVNSKYSSDQEICIVDLLSKVARLWVKQIHEKH